MFLAEKVTYVLELLSFLCQCNFFCVQCDAILWLQYILSQTCRKYCRVKKWTLGLTGYRNQIAIIRASGSISRVRGPLSTSSSGIVAEQFIEKIRTVRGTPVYVQKKYIVFFFFCKKHAISENKKMTHTVFTAWALRSSLNYLYFSN